MQRELAVALGYRPREESAPRILASGRGRLAERIRELAQQHDVPLREDTDLAELLTQLPIADEIPPDLYPAVAEIFAFLYRVARGMESDASSTSEITPSGNVEE